ncbi:MAG: hypothetical protein ACC612_04690 [Methanomethylovorans sp.]|uniref:hypothetical protein n=1 Tax=Methanomethylovorans sp. TaxID=2758717 RepID=UPI00353093C6
MSTILAVSTVKKTIKTMNANVEKCTDNESAKPDNELADNEEVFPKMDIYSISLCILI